MIPVISRVFNKIGIPLKYQAGFEQVILESLVLLQKLYAVEILPISIQQARRKKEFCAVVEAELEGNPSSADRVLGMETSPVNADVSQFGIKKDGDAKKVQQRGLGPDLKEDVPALET
jgi:hypothetical protein